MLNKLANPHPSFYRQASLWLILQASILLLPLFPALGGIGLIFVLVRVFQLNFAQVINYRINWGLLLVSIWLVINSALAYQPGEAWLGLANFLPYFALFAATRTLIDTPNKLNRLAWLLVLPSAPIVVLGLGQLYGNWQSVPLIKNIFGWELISQGVPTGRMSSVFIYANFLAIYLVITFILSLGMWFKNWRQHHNLNPRLLVLSSILILNSLGLILANSRNAWLLVLLACLAFALYLSWYWLVAAIAAIIAIISGASFGSFQGQAGFRKIVPQFIWGRLSDQSYPDRPIETLRLSQWQFSWQKIQQRPLHGWGLRNFTPMYLEETNLWFGHPHNLFIMLGLEIGLVATLVFCSLIGAIVFITTVKTFFPKSIDLDYHKLQQADKLIIFTYLLAFVCCTLFNFVDVSIFDFRVNTIGWILLASIAGVITDRHKFRGSQPNIF